MRQKKEKKEQKKTPEPQADGDTYDVEGVVGHSWRQKELGGEVGLIVYETKWDGYPSSENTLQFTRDFGMLKPIVDYWKSTLAGKKCSAKEKAVAYAITLAHEWQKNQVLFWNDDDCLLTSPPRPDWIIRSYEWNKRSKDSLSYELALELYQHQVNMMAQGYRNHPHITIRNKVDYALPVPVPYITFRLEDKRTSSRKRPREEGPTGPKPEFTDKNGLTLTWKSHYDFLKYNAEITESLDPFSHKTATLKSIDYCREQKMKDSHIRPMEFHEPRVWLQLRRNLDKFWELVADDDIQKGRTVMLLTGEICPPDDAKKAMEDHGEIYALSSFVKLTDNVCIDTSNRHGFDKYIQHSCEPNCYVEVTWPYRLDNAPPLAIVKAKRDIRRGEDLTIDWFEGFGEYDKRKNYRSGRSPRDHLMCSCDKPSCRGVLWLEEIEGEQQYNKMPKKQRLKQQKEPFRGLPVVRKRNI